MGPETLQQLSGKEWGQSLLHFVLFSRRSTVTWGALYAAGESQATDNATHALHVSRLGD